MKLSSTVIYGLRATLLLAERNQREPLPCSVLAKTCGMPQRFLLQVLRRMVQQGLLDSARGLHGGYRLAKRPEEISLYSIITATGGLVQSGHSSLDDLPPMARGIVKQTLEGISDHSRRQLEAIKICDLMPGDRNSGAVSVPLSHHSSFDMAAQLVQ